MDRESGRRYLYPGHPALGGTFGGSRRLHEPVLARGLEALSAHTPLLHGDAT